MDRRDFIRTAGTLLAGATLHARSFAAAPSHAARAGRILPINRGWKFLPSVPSGGHDAAFDESAMSRVVLPHTNRMLPWHGFDDREYEFVSLYRRKFHLPAAAKGKRVFVDFEGAMTASTLWINGRNLGEYKGGYTSFSFELTDYAKFDDENVLALDVDSTERPDIPPFGYQVDYLTFGGLYREVNLRVVPKSFIANIFARSRNVLKRPQLDVQCMIERAAAHGKLHVEVLLEDGGKLVARAGAMVAGADATVQLPALPRVQLWNLDNPKLYTVRVRLSEDDRVIDEDTRRFGFREASFTDRGFEFNGKIVKLRGLNRHQTFPFVGQAMGRRVQRRDAWILKNELHLNLVRTSHYPQSRHFLDACDELGLMVLEEIPGWQHIGDAAWKNLAVDNVERMITRDWNHPSIILWGVRINESQDDHDFYTRTNALAHKLDPSRQTGGIRNNYKSELLEDVFTMNDFPWPPRAPNHPRYLNTEFCGHMFPTKSIDNNERHAEHFIRHARMHDWMASNLQYSGAIGWCAFDYNTHRDFGAGDRICYHGVMDIFRLPKPAAGFYKSQIEPENEVVIEPAFHWALGDSNERLKKAVIASNCDHLKLYLLTEGTWELLAELDPDREQFPHLRYAPFVGNLEHVLGWNCRDLKIEGYVNGELRATRFYSGLGVDRKFEAVADDAELVADGADATRVVLRVTDEFGNVRPYASDPIVLELEGPADVIGDNPFALFGGVGAVWIRAREQPGTARLTAIHPRLGSKTVELAITAAADEAA